MEQNYLEVIEYPCKVCGKRHKKGDALFGEHYEQGFAHPKGEMNQEDRLLTVEKALALLTDEEKTVWGSLPERERRIIADIMVKAIKAQDAKALKDVGELLERHSCQITKADIGHWGQILSNEALESLKRGEMPKGESTSSNAS